MSKLDIASEMAAIDEKDRKFYESLSEDEQKKFTTYLMIRWAATVDGNADMQEYYLHSTNQKLNKNYFAVSDTLHRQLNWLAVTTISPGMGKRRHTWIGAPKKTGGTSKIAKFISKYFPDMKYEDMKLLEELNTKAHWKKYAEDLGLTKDQIKKELG